MVNKRDSNYTFVDYVIGSGEVDYGNVLGSRQNLSQGIQKLYDKAKPADKARLTKWLDDSLWDKESTVSHKSLNNEIDKNNSDWYKRIKDDIDTINSIEDVDPIRENIANDEGNYEEETAEGLRTTLGKAIGKLADKYIASLKTKSQKEIEDIPRGEIKRNYSKDDATRILDEIDSIQAGFPSGEEEFKGSVMPEINSATTSSDLDSVEERILRDSPSGRLESELLREIQSKREELLREEQGDESNE